ncbi:MAG TPA: GNAT family N-acetyltransferase [Acidobacteriota bacterium]|nr:GNAT family N-acetyltransferase [Acidobacteriota bacterium]
MNGRFISTYNELKEISADWDAFIEKSEFTSFFSTSGFTRAWWRAYENSRNMHVVIVTDENGELRLIAPFQAEKRNPERWELVGTHLINYNPLLMKTGDKDALDYFFVWLKQQSGWEKLVFRVLANATISKVLLIDFDASSFARWLRLGSFFVEHEARRDHPYISKTALKNFINLLHEKSYRHGLNILKREGTPDFQMTMDIEEFRKYFDRFCELHIAEWGSRGRNSQLSDPETRNFYSYLIDEMVDYKTLRLGVLKINDKPIAFSMGAKWNDRIDSWITCFDIEHARVGPGKLLRGYLIQNSIEEGASEFDLGRGLQPHKLEFTPDLRETVIFSIYRSPIHALATKLKALRKVQQAAL